MGEGDPQIGRYRVVQLLGRGGMGDVYLASSQGVAGFEKQVVLKVLRPQGRHALDLLREAFIGVTLEHANIVQVLDLGEHEGRYFIVMEYVRGLSFGQLLADAEARGVRLPLRLTTRALGHVADALDHVHSVGDGIIHRDVSSSNVLLSLDGRVKLADFGVATLTGESKGSGGIVGKPAYLPPEAFDGTRPTQAWDVYALGVVLWKALAGRDPFRGSDASKIRAAVLAGPPPFPAGTDVPPALVEVAERAISADPSRRYATAAALRRALEAACPPEAGDLEVHRAYMRDCFAAEGFTERFRQHLTNEPSASRQSASRDTPVPRLSISDAPTMDAAIQPIRIGLSQAGGSGWARGEGERLAARLAAKIDRPVVSVVLADYRSLVDTLSTGALDLAWMPPVAFVEAERHGARALAVASRLGKTTYFSAIIARADSDISTLSDLRGKTIAWVDRDSASGYLFALAELVRSFGGTEKLGRQHFVGSHRAVCEAVADGWAAAGATYAILDDRGEVTTSGWHERLGARAGEIKVVAFTRKIPGDNVAARPGLDPDLRKQLFLALVDLSADDEGRKILVDVFRAEALVPAPGDIYGDVRSTLAILKGV
ncbi:MAG: phosphate/phosphite/phosphonate ABC transporter substrate-binding protein [Myxococcales bacterium]|nr:phosphate/phosphite/phosphonate ABC transporter substrate-binding protein [Myxococcales bacterium]